MENPAGYLYRAGRSRARHRRKLRVVFPEEPSFNPPWVEPGLPKALERLTEKQAHCPAARPRLRMDYR